MCRPDDEGYGTVSPRGLLVSRRSTNTKMLEMLAIATRQGIGPEKLKEETVTDTTLS